MEFRGTERSEKERRDQHDRRGARKREGRIRRREMRDERRSYVVVVMMVG